MRQLSPFDFRCSDRLWRCHRFLARRVGGEVPKCELVGSAPGHDPVCVLQLASASQSAKHFIAFIGRDIKQTERTRDLGEGFELWDLRHFRLDEFIVAIKQTIPPVNANVLNNYATADESSDFGITEKRFGKSSWGLLVPVSRDDAIANSFPETKFLLDLYSPHFLHATFEASDFGLRKTPPRGHPPITAHFENRSEPFTKPEFVKFSKQLLITSEYGAWQLDRAQKWGKEDWRLFVASMLYQGLIEYDNHKDSFGWQRESSDMATILEALFTAGDSRNEEIGYRLRKRLAALLVHRLPTVEKDTRDLYDTRSGFVHGSFFMGLEKTSRLNDGDPPVSDFGILYRQKENVRWALIAYLALAKAFGSAKHQFKGAETVMKALDDAIIDTELRARLAAIADEVLMLLPGLPETPAGVTEPTVLVFQYGSNTSSARLNDETRLKNDAKDLGLVRTRDTFEFDFDVWSDQNNCYVSDIRAGSGRPIWGVLYEIPEYLIDRKTAKARKRKSLDAIEGTRYRRHDIAVELPDGTPIDRRVITYMVIEPQPTQKTSLAYATHILTGLRDHDAPAEYIAYVKERIIKSNPDLAVDIQKL